VFRRGKPIILIPIRIARYDYGNVNISVTDPDRWRACIRAPPTKRAVDKGAGL